MSDNVRNYWFDRIDYAATSFHHVADERLYRLTLGCVDKFFIEVGKSLRTSAINVVRMWAQKYGPGG